MLKIIWKDDVVFCLNYNQAAMLVDSFRDTHHAKENENGDMVIEKTAENLRDIVSRGIETRQLDEVWGVNAKQLMESLQKFTDSDAGILMNLVQRCFEILTERARRGEFFVGAKHLPIERTDLYGAGLLGNAPAYSDSGNTWRPNL